MTDGFDINFFSQAFHLFHPVVKRKLTLTKKKKTIMRGTEFYSVFFISYYPLSFVVVVVFVVFSFVVYVGMQ